MSEVTFGEIQRLVVQSAREGVEAYVRSTDVFCLVPWHATDDEWVVATVGFVAGEQTGRITLLCERRLARRIQHAAIRNPGISELGERDLIGELANMLSGRLKHHLLALGIGIDITTPETGISRNMRPTARGPFPTCLAVPLGSDTLYIDLQTSADGTDRALPVQANPVVAPVVAEGDLVFF